MLGVAGILGQEILNPEQWWYSAGMPENLPSFDGNKTNMGGQELGQELHIKVSQDGPFCTPA